MQIRYCYSLVNIRLSGIHILNAHELAVFVERLSQYITTLDSLTLIVLHCLGASVLSSLLELLLGLDFVLGLFVHQLVKLFFEILSATRTIGLRMEWHP